MCFYGAPSHLQFFTDCVVIATLKQKLGDLLLAWSQLNI
jgi:hypothetical protein